jgi:peptidyl-prolyl cis-trans isomerase A (cyclophilin A)
MKPFAFVGGLLSGLLATQAGTLVQFRTALGDLEIELYDTEKPVTAANFLRYVEDGAYRDGFFHRAVRNFVFQGGGYAVTNRGRTNAAVIQVPTRPPITNEFNVGPRLNNVAGTIAMAKTSDPNSANSQFFLNLRDNPDLDRTNNSGGFTVFGRAVGDTNLLRLLNGFTAYVPTNTAASNYIVNLGGVFSELPAHTVRTNGNGERFLDLADFVHVDIAVARQIAIGRRPDGSMLISWNASARSTNAVEYTDTFPPNWTTLTNLLRPPQARPEVIDPSPTSNRFYRIRITD